MHAPNPSFPTFLLSACPDLWAVDMLFVVGGYSDIKAAGVITRECARCHVPCSGPLVPGQGGRPSNSGWRSFVVLRVWLPLSLPRGC